VVAHDRQGILDKSLPARSASYHSASVIAGRIAQSKFIGKV